ncbi:MAG: group 1 truncated hemoglobin [Polyangiaceae bacterium]|nr:group 1 truncated hemoglobin [Polyangiaceae bacterium]
MASLYESLGGEAAVDAAVQIFYRKVLSDDRISSFFDGVDMDAQMAKQKSFLTMALGGPNHYAGKDMRAAHARLAEKGLNDGHFDAVVENLVATLKELGVSAAQIDQVTSLLAGTRNDVLSR